MLLSLKSGKYLITRIIDETQEINHYIARDAGRKEYIVNEVKDVSLIGEYLKEIKSINEDERPECFAENSYLYIIFKYCDSESFSTFLGRKKIDIGKRLVYMQDIAFQLVTLDKYPDIIQKSVLMPENMVMWHNGIRFNCFLYTNTINDRFGLFRNNLHECFTDSEIAKFTYLRIVTQKFENGIYTNPTEIYRDFQQLVEMNSGRLGFVQKLKRFYEKQKGKIKVVTGIATLALVVYVLYTMIFASEQEKAAQTFTPVEQIGTVNVIEA